MIDALEAMPDQGARDPLDALLDDPLPPLPPEPALDPRGISPTAIDDLPFYARDLGEDEDGLSDEEKILRLVDRAPAWCERWFGRGPRTSWNSLKSRVPQRVMAQAFSFDELARIWLAERVMSPTSRWFEEEHRLLERIRLTTWHNAYTGCRYHDLVRITRGLRLLAFDLEGAQVGVTFTRSKWSECGRAMHDENVYLDGHLGALVYGKGKHLLTIGFTFTRHEDELQALLVQVQLRDKRRNRWLYKIDGTSIDLAARMLERAFGMNVWLVTGLSAEAAVRGTYDRSVTPDPAAMTRLASFYDAKLAHYDRTNDLLSTRPAFGGRTFVRLSRREPS